MRESREGFMRLPEREPEAVIYGVTTGYGQMEKQRLEADQRRAHAARSPHAAAASFGESLPERIVGGIIFARLVNLTVMPRSPVMTAVRLARRFKDDEGVECLRL